MSTVDERSVAVVGMACRLPGATGPDELWNLLSEGGDATGSAPRQRRELAGTVGRAGYLAGVADFDAEFFGMSAAEAVELDPQQRLLLMTAWEALEDAGQRPDLLAGSRAGVFVGGSRADYLENVFRQGLSAVTAGQLNNVRALPATRRDLPDLGRPAIAGVSGQGSSTLNVHVVLRQAPTPSVGEQRTGATQVLALSARTPEALTALSRAYVAYLGGPGTAYPVSDICFSAATRRQHLTHRLAVVGTTHQDLVDALTGASASTHHLADRYAGGEVIDWTAVFGDGGRYVPLPTYPWQTKRYWPGERHEDEGDDLATRILRRHARTHFHAESTLADIGIDSLAKLQLIVELQQRTGREVAPEVLDRLRTVGELRRWTHDLVEAAR